MTFRLVSHRIAHDPQPIPHVCSSDPKTKKKPSLLCARTTLCCGFFFCRDVVEVLEDSEDAKKWPRWSPRPTSDCAPASIPCSEIEKRDSPTPSSLAPAPASAVDPSPSASTTATPTPESKRSGPRKPRTALLSIPKASQTKKITTLDKSAMDWRAHVASQSSDVKDGLDANRRGGGYLEKVEFLKRVQDRREDAFEASKLSKRRKA